MKIVKATLAALAAASLLFGFASCKSKETAPAPADYGGGVSDYSYTTGK